MDYTEVRFYNDVSLNEAIIAWLGENDFDMFEERTNGLNAYIAATRFDAKSLEEIISNIPDAKENIRYETSLIKDQNWNTRWESNFEPVLIGNAVYIRAPFHEPGKQYEYEIIIEPKMSFGTGHHATTSLMIESMMHSEFKGKRVLDMGCGTGILAILASMRGAQDVTAVDVDEWAVTNCRENCSINGADNIKIILGNESSVKGEKYDIILANINRNILLGSMNHYEKLLDDKGEIFLSGILTEDRDIICRHAGDCRLKLSGEKSRDQWLALRFKKSGNEV